MRSRILVVALIALVYLGRQSASAAPNSPAGNLLPNPSFEIANSAGTGPDSWSASDAQAVWDSTMAHSGNYSVETSLYEMWRTTITVPNYTGGTYVFSTWHYDTGCPNAHLVWRTRNQFGATLNDWQQVYLPCSLNNWSQDSIQINMCDPTVCSDLVYYVDFQLQSNLDVSWWDDVSFSSEQPPTCYTLTTSVNPSGSGSISANPGPNCGNQYTAGTNVQLTANAASGYTFNSWSGGTGGLANPTTVTINGSTNVTANFTGIAISHIEVTQVVQDITNTVPLVAGKPTFVRVYVDCGLGCDKRPSVSGTLQGYGPSGELSGSPLQPLNSQGVIAFHDSWLNQRGDLRKSLNFTLPMQWTTGTVTLTALLPGVQYSEVVTYQQAKTINVIYVPIRYNGKLPDISHIAKGAHWANQVYPTSKIDYVPGTTFDWNQCLEDNLSCNFFNTRDLNIIALKSELTTRYRLVNARVFGWLPAGTFGGGDSDPAWFGGAGKAAFGDDHPTEAPRTFAHEIAHLLNRRHANTIDNLNYPASTCARNYKPNLFGVPNDVWLASVDLGSDWVMTASFTSSKILDYGLNGYGFGWLISAPNALKKPADNFDYMSYCGRIISDTVWTSAWTYEHIFSETLKADVPTLAPAQIASPQLYFIASGAVYTDDTAIFDPMWILTSTTVPDNPSIGTRYCLESQDVSNTVLASRCFDLNFQNYETDESTGVDGFNLMLPYHANVSRIVLKKGIQELAVRSVSANAPILTITSPITGEAWAAAGTYTITWAANDADGDPLTYNVLYSPDGNNWVAVGNIITATQLVIDSRELAGGNSAKVRVMASDGVNTTATDSAAFTVTRKGPQAYILSPDSDGIIPPNTPLFLQGYAYDLEDGTIGDADLSWMSNKDGALGTGGNVLATLSAGEHEIMLNAVDSDGNTTSTSINIFVGYKVYLPLILNQRISAFTVTKTADTNDGNCNADCSLREAIIAANATPGDDTIILPAGTYVLTIPGADENASATGDLDISSNLTIIGAGADRTIISSGIDDRVIHIIGYGAFPVTGQNVTISGVSIKNGKGVSAGGGVFSCGSLTLVDSMIIGNSALNNGGGIKAYCGNLQLTNVTIANNSVGYFFSPDAHGGGIYIEHIPFTATNSTISDNTSIGDGGGIYISYGNDMINLNNVTIANNIADTDNNGTGDGGGIAVDMFGPTINFVNSIVAGNIDKGNQAPDCSGAFNIIGYSIVQNLTGCTISGSISGSIFGVNPMLGPLQSNGGFTLTRALLPGSPAIDAGTNLGCPATDQRGVTRPQGTRCDIGAYEYVPH